ncbi:gamma-glutamyl-gamma-aminobutyrate hydrolase family protein [Terrihalobacillus insolitus]|uniref:gamma-glutamyl-gamma-aminobutyrate hydrolase family protein n=1 Tax=Terrihalobacillus insolitus TaxID=2950438 RepID=UPI002341CDB2|nr:gamma-glutamyl-gamma-aminobutyrate hydrolase family protein [Terrihalobacillus insolitus]MDC3414410.1 gamma-glutamyl-gamma-aminobutyrate hydrolase family protein [Terrihalobacillus insolitus]
MKPLIGITSSIDVDEQSSTVGTDNIKAITRAGGLPIILPNFLQEEDIDQVADTIDGFYATGGYDIDPTLFGEEPHPNLGLITPERDRFEVALIKKLLEQNKPILAVCRGCQIVNIAAGGTMYQDIYAQMDQELLQHQQKAPKGHGSHYVQVETNSLLYDIIESRKLKVNSRHHQANREVPSTFKISGKANDGVIEAIESSKHTFVLGLQWHPENMAATGDITSLRIYQSFIRACQK